MNRILCPGRSRRASLRVDMGWSAALKLAQQIPTFPQENRRLKAILIKIPDHVAQLTLRAAARGALSEKGDPDGLHFER